MKITTMLSLGALGALLLGPACDNSSKDAKPADAKAAKSEAKAADAKAADAEAADAEAADAKAADAKADGGAAGADAELPKIGVAECDEYITKMHACLQGDAIPEDIRDGQRTGFDISVKSWADSAKTHPESASNLVQGCKAARDAASKQFPSCFAAQ